MKKGTKKTTTKPTTKIWISLNKTLYYPGEQVFGFLYLKIKEGIKDPNFNFCLKGELVANYIPLSIESNRKDLKKLEKSLAKNLNNNQNE